MRKLMKSMLRHVTAFILIIGLVGCQMVGISGSEESDPNAEKKTLFIKSINDNKELILECLHNDPAYGEPGTLAKTAAQDSIETYLNNPEMLYNDLMAQDKGQEYLDFVYAVSVSSDADEILEKAEPLMSEVQYDSLKQSIEEIDTSMIIGIGKTTDGIAIDKKIHFLAGASGALVVASFAYSICPIFQLQLKIATAAALGLSSAVLAGAIKEIADLNPDVGTPEWADFFATLFGGASGAVLFIAVGAISTALGLSPVGGSIILGILGLWGVLEVLNYWLGSL